MPAVVRTLFKLGGEMEIWLGTKSRAGNLLSTAKVLAGNLPTLATDAGLWISLIVSTVSEVPLSKGLELRLRLS